MNKIFSLETVNNLIAKIGYNEVESDALLKSGIFPISFESLPTEHKLALNRSEPVNLFSSDFDPSLFVPLLPKTNSILMIDTYTGAMWLPCQLNPVNIYGFGELHTANEILDYPVLKMGRSRFWKFPYYIVDNLQQLKNFFNDIKDKFKPKHVPLYFRGQTHDHTIIRDNTVKKVLFGLEDVHETSLLSNAYRHGFDYFKEEALMRLLIYDIDNRSTQDAAKLWHVDSEFEQIDIEAKGVNPRNAINVTMSMSQHYGIPTYGIDVSSSWEIAWWFATHPHIFKNGQVTIGEFNWHEKDSSDFPVIYILRSPHGINLQRTGLPATRPIAQNAHFIHGSWGTHGNVCSEDIIAAVVLGPNVGVLKKETQSIYPPPHEDLMYQELLKYKDIYLKSSEKSFLSQIFEINY